MNRIPNKKVRDNKFIDDPKPERGYSSYIMVMVKEKVRPSGWKTVLTVTVFIIILLNLPALAAGVTITGVRLDREGPNLLLSVNLTGPLEPKVFSIDNKGPKPRVVIDFQGAKAVRLPSKIKSPSLLAKSVRIGRHPDKVRLVIDLQVGRTYLVEQFYTEAEKQYLLRLSIAKKP